MWSYDLFCKGKTTLHKYIIAGMVASNDNKKEQYYKCSKCGVVKRLSDMTHREKSLLY